MTSTRFRSGFKFGAVSVIAIAGTLGCSVVAPSIGLASTVPTILQKKLAQAPATSQMLEQAVLTQINQHRATLKLPPLTLNATISEQARSHSQAMAIGQVPFSHNGFQQRVATIARIIPYSRAAENVAYNQGYSDPVSQAVQGWLQSAGHRQNIEGSFDLTGIGVAQNAKGEYYFTQIFIHRR